MLPHLNISSRHSSQDFLKTLSTCCLGRGRKKGDCRNFIGNTHIHQRTHSGSCWAGDKVQVLYWWWATLRDTQRQQPHTHTQPVSICTHIQGKSPALRAAHSLFVSLLARLNILQAFHAFVFLSLCVCESSNVVLTCLGFYSKKLKIKQGFEITIWKISFCPAHVLAKCLCILPAVL